MITPSQIENKNKTETKANCFTAICKGFSKRRRSALSCFKRKNEEIQESVPVAGTELDKQALVLLAPTVVVATNTMERGSLNTGDDVTLSNVELQPQLDFIGANTVVDNNYMLDALNVDNVEGSLQSTKATAASETYQQDFACGEGVDISSEAGDIAQSIENGSDSFDPTQMTAEASQELIVKKKKKRDKKRDNPLDKIVHKMQLNLLASPNNFIHLPKYMQTLVFIEYVKLHTGSVSSQNHGLVQVPRLLRNSTQNNILLKKRYVGRYLLSKAQRKVARGKVGPTIAWAAFGYYKPKPKKGESITLMNSLSKAVKKCKKKAIQRLLREIVVAFIDIRMYI